MRKNSINLAILSIGSIFALNVFAQDTSIPKFNQDFKVSAEIEAGCFLTAENINFGVLSMPLSDQSASANMKVHCSKGAPLKINIAYGETFSVVSNKYEGYVIKFNTSYPTYNKYTIYNKNMKEVGNIGCNFNGGYQYNFIDNPNNASQKNNPDMQVDLPCVANGTKEGTKPVGWEGEYNKSGYYPINYGVESGGVLNGINKSETIKYYLTIPSKDTIWSSYSGFDVVATGGEQIIPMKANIKRAENVTHRMTPDTYQSVLTVILTY